MSNIVEPQITETKPSMFSDFIKNNPKFINDLVSGGFPAQQQPAFQKNNGEPYVFLKDFSFSKTIFNDGGSDLRLGATKLITENYKKDQVVYPFPSSPNVRMIPNPAFTKAINEGVLVPQKTAQQQALQQAQQQALLKEYSQMGYSGLTDKVFGKQQGWSFERPMRLGAYIIVGAVVGRYVAKNMKKSTTLGMVVGGLAPLLAYQLSIEYDRKNMPKQEPRQKVVMNPDGSIMTEKQISNTQVSSDISKFIPQNKPKLGNPMPIDWSNTLLGKKDCPNGTKKIEVNCFKAPCPEMEVCA